MDKNVWSIAEWIRRAFLVCICLFIYGLFNNAVSSSDCSVEW
jgi:hypothetical protein